jgi:hypothetical protein
LIGFHFLAYASGAGLYCSTNGFNSPFWNSIALLLKHKLKMKANQMIGFFITMSFSLS